MHVNYVSPPTQDLSRWCYNQSQTSTRRGTKCPTDTPAPEHQEQSAQDPWDPCGSARGVQEEPHPHAPPSGDLPPSLPGRHGHRLTHHMPAEPHHHNLEPDRQKGGPHPTIHQLITPTKGEYIQEDRPWKSATAFHPRRLEGSPSMPPAPDRVACHPTG